MLSRQPSQMTLDRFTGAEYTCQANLNLYDSPACDRLATQAARGRHLQILADLPPAPTVSALPIRLCEDGYPAWLAVVDLPQLERATEPYQPTILQRPTIELRLPEAIAFTQAAMQQSNEYLWGGTVAPNYDCSGLMQAAFASVGVWLPRDAYQQEGFVQAIAPQALLPGDLVFFGPPEKATHVGLYLGADRYIHSSGKDQGRNGIGIDHLSATTDPVSQAYARQWRGAGRIVQSYAPIAGGGGEF